MSNLISLTNEIELKTSSVLNKNSKEFGKQYLIDCSDETCWSSHSGTPQWVAMKWNKPVKISQLQVKFQGGFCGSRDTVVEGWTDEGSYWELLEKWPLEDVGSLQMLTIKDTRWFTKLRLFFPSSTDFYGRIIIYNMNILGEKS